MEEEWITIPNYDNAYEISSLGNVRSVDRYVGGKCGTRRRINGCTRKQFLNNSGYFIVVLAKEGRLESVLVHLLVASAFMGHNSDGGYTVIDHIDNDRTNNAVCNLRIVTQRENVIKGKRNDRNPSNALGVYKRGNRWAANIFYNGGNVHIGTFDTKNEAVAYRKAALRSINNGNPPIVKKAERKRKINRSRYKEK